MEWAFALPDSASVTWGTNGMWLSKDDPFPADDPFVLAHLDMFSLTPSRARSTDGRVFLQVPMSELPVDAPLMAAPRGRGRVNG